MKPPHDFHSIEWSDQLYAERENLKTIPAGRFWLSMGRKPILLLRDKCNRPSPLILCALAGEETPWVVGTFRQTRHGSLSFNCPLRHFERLLQGIRGLYPYTKIEHASRTLNH